MLKLLCRFVCCEKEAEIRRRREIEMSINEIITGLFEILDKVKTFLLNFGEIAQDFFNALP